MSWVLGFMVQGLGSRAIGERASNTGGFRRGSFLESIGKFTVYLTGRHVQVKFQYQFGSEF